jgi:hypothetical protein
LSDPSGSTVLAGSIIRDDGSAPNMETDAKSRCCKNFPKPFCEETTVGEDGYLNKEIHGKEALVDTNRWAVPYNPYDLVTQM